MKILTIVGARPQFIKASALTREVKKYDDITEVMVHTGQHFDHDMSDIFFDELGIGKPKYNLNINSTDHNTMTGRMMIELQKVFTEEAPDFVLVYGDTNSTLAGALCAVKLGIPLVHVEAGLRSFNKAMPEEINRILTDRVSDFLFCPTQQAVENLKREGMPEANTKVANVGDIMFDVAQYCRQLPASDELDLPSKFALLTVHRANNTDDEASLSGIVRALNRIHETIPVVSPLHPRTVAALKRFDLKPAFQVLKPVSYLAMTQLLKSCQLVITDSGGLQKEAYFHNKYCVTLRDETEWVELIEHGVNTLVGANEDKIMEAVMSGLDRSVDCSPYLYGRGDTASQILDELRASFR